MTVQSDITEGIPVSLGPALYRIVTPSGLASTVAFGTAEAETVLLPDGIGSVVSVGTTATVATVEPAGIDSGTGAAGQASLALVLKPDGVASAIDTGDPVLNSEMEPPGILDSPSFGVAESFTSMNPSGFDAAGAGLGDPNVTLALNPDGIASSAQAGDVDTIATVFIVPGPVDPSNDFGNHIARSKRLIFRPSTQTLGWGWYKRFEGISLIKKDGAWQEIPWPTIDETIEADIYLGGGRDHAVSTALAAELIAEGYSISEEF